MSDDFNPWTYKDPMDDYIRDFDGKMRSRYQIEQRERARIEAQAQRIIERQMHPEIAQRERAQAIQANPLIEHRKENLKAGPPGRGRGNCFICHHQDREKIEQIYRDKSGDAKATHKAMTQAGMKLSHTAVWRHFKRHYKHPDGRA